MNTTSLRELTIRTFQESDQVALLQLMNAADAVDQTDRGMTAKELAYRLEHPKHDPAADLLLAVNLRGDAAGFADIFHRPGYAENVYFVDGAVHPDCRGRGVGMSLLHRALDLVNARLPVGLERPSTFQCSCDARQSDAQALFQSFRMRPVRHFWEMESPPLENLPELQIPHGYTLRAYRAAADVALLMDAGTAAFADQWGAGAGVYKAWGRMLSGPQFRPELCLIAFAEGEPGRAVGLCVCELNLDHIARTGRNEGYVGTLGVRPGHRRQGLGQALLLAGLQALRRAGVVGAYLHVDSDTQTGAPNLYRSVGFVARRQQTAYHKVIRES